VHLALVVIPDLATWFRENGLAVARPDTKHARIIAMLRAPTGATIAAIMTATEWQPHSVRGFLAGVVRKKLGLNLASEQTDKGRVYRIKDGKASSQVDALVQGLAWQRSQWMRTIKVRPTTGY
jgi:streptogramin lyase